MITSPAPMLIGARYWTVGLDWRTGRDGKPLSPDAARATASAERRRWRVDGPSETGFLGETPTLALSPEGVPALAPALRDHLIAEDNSWLALLEADTDPSTPPAERDPRVAWIEVRRGRFDDRADRVFASAETILATLALYPRVDYRCQSPDTRPRIFASASLAEQLPPELCAVVLDPAEIADPADRYRAVPARSSPEYRIPLPPTPASPRPAAAAPNGESPESIPAQTRLVPLNLHPDFNDPLFAVVMRLRDVPGRPADQFMVVAVSDCRHEMEYLCRVRNAAHKEHSLPNDPILDHVVALTEGIRIPPNTDADCYFELEPLPPPALSTKDIP